VKGGLDTRPVPLQTAILLMPAVFGLAVLVAPAIGALGLVWLAEFAIIEPVCFGLPALVAARATTGSVRGALALSRPTRRALAGALLFGGTFWYLNATLIAPLLAEHTSASDRALAGALADQMPLALEVLVLAVIPAVCEELLVRGAIARGIAARLGPVAGVLLSSAYFALLHLSLARALPTAVLGAALAIVVLCTGSLVPAMLIHALNNTAALLLGDPSMSAAVDLLARHPLAALFASSIGSLAGLFLLLRRR
jgi:membrane protease YdiL (CAAX protease family)